jgi:deazaflavin-dependent oxidoreductase (nitroreductase family)
MTPLRHLFQRHRIAAFIVLAWGISWAYWIPMALRGDVVTPGGNVTHFPGLVGPLIAAFIVTAVADGGDAIRDLVGRMFRWRVPLRWYLVAATPFLMFLVAVALLAATGGETPGPAELGEFSGLPVLAFPLVVLLVLVFNMYGEEVGWRGFLTPQLLARHGPFVTSLLVAITWVTWHVPSFFVIETYRDMGLAIIPMMGIGILAGSIVLTWAYVGSGGSILIVVLWHLALNFSSATTAGRGMPGAFVWTGIVLWSIVVGLTWLVASEPRTRPLATRLRDGSLMAIIRSPLGRFLHGMTVIQFRGRRSGRLLMTPVECVREGDRLVVLVSHPEKKQWWRNVQASPDVTVAVDGHDLVGRAIVHVGDDAEAEADLGTYVAHRPRVAKALGLPADLGVDTEALAAAASKAVSVRIEFRPLQAG